MKDVGYILKTIHVDRWLCVLKKLIFDASILEEIAQISLLFLLWLLFLLNLKCKMFFYNFAAIVSRMNVIAGIQKKTIFTKSFKLYDVMLFQYLILEGEEIMTLKIISGHSEGNENYHFQE